MLRLLQSWFTDVSDEGRAFDARWGTRTCHFDFGNYEPSLPSRVQAALDIMDLGPEGVTFLDVGSGKGRVALLASQRPWRQVVGIERRRGLHRLAEQNLAAFRARGGPACPVVLQRGDACEHPLPEGPTVAFLYNSLPAHTLRRFVARFQARPARLVYLNPQHPDVLLHAGWSCRVRFDDPHDEAWSWHIYEGG